jgi:hypothetical protein
LLGRIQQRVNLAHRTIYAPALAQVAPLQNELPDGDRDGILDVCYFCYDRYYRL